MLIAVVSAKAETQGFQSLAPLSSQGQALGPRVRGDDEFVRREDIPTASFAPDR